MGAAVSLLESSASEGTLFGVGVAGRADDSVLQNMGYRTVEKAEGGGMNNRERPAFLFAGEPAGLPPDVWAWSVGVEVEGQCGLGPGWQARRLAGLPGPLAWESQLHSMPVAEPLFSESGRGNKKPNAKARLACHYRPRGRTMDAKRQVSEMVHCWEREGLVGEGGERDRETGRDGEREERLLLLVPGSD